MLVLLRDLDVAPGRLEELSQTYPSATFLVEDRANGSALIASYRAIIPKIIPINPVDSKEERAAACSPAVEAGNVYLPEGAPWAGDFIEELAAFPRGKHDDQVDALSQLMNWAASNVRSSVWDAYRSPSNGGRGGKGGPGGMQNIVDAWFGIPPNRNYRER